MRNENWKPSKTSRTSTHPIYFFMRQQSFSFFPARVATRKINLGVGVLVQDPMIVMTLNLTGWHLQVRRCVWNRILLIVRNENWKPIKKHHEISRTNTRPIYFFLRQQSAVFPFFQLAWPRVRLICVCVLVWGPMVWIRWDCLNFLHTVPPSASVFAGRVESCVWAWLASLEAICSWNFGYLHPYLE